MKPVIKKQTHYNVLFMRDDGAAKTYRVRCGMLRFLIVFPIVLVLICAGIIAAGLHYGKDYLALRAGYEKQEKEISEMRLQLERLVNLETLLSASSSNGVPLAKHEEVGVSAPPSRSQNATTAATAEADQPETPATEEPAPVPTPEPPAVEPVTAQQPAEPSRNAAITEPFSTSGSMARIASAESPVRVSNFSGRPIGQQRVRIRYELATAPNQEGKMLSGLAKHYAIFSNGDRTELTLQDNGETRFAITRMKPMEATARLPQGYDTKDIKQIDVVIMVDDLGNYHDLFEVTQWRSY